MTFSVFVEEAVRRIKVERGHVLTQDGAIEEEEIEKALDGSNHTDLKECFVSRRHQKAWATLEIPWSSVTHVNILNSGRNFRKFFLTFL